MPAVVNEIVRFFDFNVRQLLFDLDVELKPKILLENISDKIILCN